MLDLFKMLKRPKTPVGSAAIQKRLEEFEVLEAAKKKTRANLKGEFAEALATGNESRIKAVEQKLDAERTDLRRIRGGRKDWEIALVEARKREEIERQDGMIQEMQDLCDAAREAMGRYGELVEELVPILEQLDTNFTAVDRLRRQLKQVGRIEDLPLHPEWEIRKGGNLRLPDAAVIPALNADGKSWKCHFKKYKAPEPVVLDTRTPAERDEAGGIKITDADGNELNNAGFPKDPRAGRAVLNRGIRGASR